MAPFMVILWHRIAIEVFEGDFLVVEMPAEITVGVKIGLKIDGQLAMTNSEITVVSWAECGIHYQIGY